ncbi:hypothetical protein HanXRQr2_Chr11g0471041 [Helianthus annuus]|uniref:Uncharacterized protein n=1 Tax=Helianthus annuus TaxID=4232 RepID=A0A9K3MYI6_HELAN|nr:hypothetical protein HanXRQr2_Chr11g0471041 [Helianthus annuus]KAJ0516020.1 hypothetical protein HanHA89_Chr11g0409191 [Helianthus annuus]
MSKALMVFGDSMVWAEVGDSRVFGEPYHAYHVDVLIQSSS